MNKRQPTHPGRVLSELYLKPLGLTVSLVAQRLGVSRKTFSRIINERGNILPDMALRLSKAFATTPEVWINLQKNYDLYQATKRTGTWKKIKPFHFPIQNVA